MLPVLPWRFLFVFKDTECLYDTAPSIFGMDNSVNDGSGC